MKKLAKKSVQVADPKRKELERRVEEGAKKALKEYSGVFKRLAEYDRTAKIEN